MLSFMEIVNKFDRVEAENLLRYLDHSKDIREVRHNFGDAPSEKNAFVSDLNIMCMLAKTVFTCSVLKFTERNHHVNRRAFFFVATQSMYSSMRKNGLGE